jgi:hypothetical protein
LIHNIYYNYCIKNIFFFFKYKKKMPSKSPNKLSKSSSSSSSKAAGISPRLATRVSSRAASPRAATPRLATRVSPRAASPRAATNAVSPRAASPRSASPSAAAAFAAYVAAKDTNRLHNLPVDVQTYIMKLAKQRKKNSKGKYELYKKIYYNREVFREWLDEIKRNGVDSKKRVRNPLREGGLIYTNKNGLYPTLRNLCVHIFQGDYNFDKIPYPIKIDYKPQSKFWNKPQ